MPIGESCAMKRRSQERLELKTRVSFAAVRFGIFGHEREGKRETSEICLKRKTFTLCLSVKVFFGDQIPFFLFLEFGRCRTVARSLHEHKR